MIKLVDDYLNKTTMYRLVLYFLIGLLLLSVGFSIFHFLPYEPVFIILSSLFLFFFCGFINDLFSKVFQAPANIESAYITALILALIITPAKSINDYIFLTWAAVLSMASKYILAINKKHIFNPAAVAVVLTSFGFNQSASWWVGNLYLLPFVIIGGYLIVRKTKREDMVLAFLTTTVITTIIFSLIKGSGVIAILEKVVLHTALFFFASIMITEPLTMPPTYSLQIIYGIILGFFYVPYVQILGIFSTPELTLLVGNIFSYLVSSKVKLILKIKEKVQLTVDAFDFIFPLKKHLVFIPGQYMEWTLPHQKSDNRGIRRYFTIASSPTEDNLRIGVKFYDQSSTYKKALLNINENNIIVGSQIAGDFTLTKDPKKKLVFMAGGIGITPFRSMIKYLIDKNERRDITLIYSNRHQSEIVYKEIFDEAQTKLNIKTVYTLTDTTQLPANWLGQIGRVDSLMIQKEIPDFVERTFYLSGPHSMVKGFETVLQQMGVKKEKIKTDFFPGFV
jgi:ferredoxin-NADP reductase/Na+-translocating ferredoxin:NAD+ oxidoreductase RnfD subunit